MARRTNSKASDDTPSNDCEVRGAELKPIRVVRRELTRPDGTKTVVDVPVYPPFRLENAVAKPPEPSRARGRKAAGKDSKPSRKAGEG